MEENLWEEQQECRWVKECESHGEEMRWITQRDSSIKTVRWVRDPVEVWNAATKFDSMCTGRKPGSEIEMRNTVSGRKRLTWIWSIAQSSHRSSPLFLSTLKTRDCWWHCPWAAHIFLLWVSGWNERVTFVSECVENTAHFLLIAPDGVEEFRKAVAIQHVNAVTDCMTIYDLEGLVHISTHLSIEIRDSSWLLHPCRCSFREG